MKRLLPVYSMMMMAIIGLVFVTAGAGTGHAQVQGAAGQNNMPGNILTIALVDNRVGISTGFSGSRLTLFGTRTEPGELAVVVRGPRREMVVRQKSRVMGVWMNTESVRFRQVPSYYDFALSAPEHMLADIAVRQSHEIGLDALDFRPAGRENAETLQRFQSSLIRNKQAQAHFPLAPGRITFLNDNFFRADFDLPASLPTGEYIVKAHLLQDGQARASRETRFRVGQEGMSARLYIFSKERSFLYGLLVVLFALFTGWGAWALLQRE